MSNAVTMVGVAAPDRQTARKAADFLEKAAAMAGHAGLFSVAPNGQALNVELSPTILNALRIVLERMADHDEIGLLIMEAELSPESAAKILGISRPVVYHRMDSGRLPYRQIGAHRRVLMKDVLKLKEFEDRRRTFSAALSEDTEDLELEGRELDRAHSPQGAS